LKVARGIHRFPHQPHIPRTEVAGRFKNKGGNDRVEVSAIEYVSMITAGELRVGALGGKGGSSSQTQSAGQSTPATAELLDDKSYIEKRAAMVGFCSCKADIHAVHGNNLGATPQTDVHQQRMMRHQGLQRRDWMIGA
jgi:hypothetical protein